MTEGPLLLYRVTSKRHHIRNIFVGPSSSACPTAPMDPLAPADTSGYASPIGTSNSLRPDGSFYSTNSSSSGLEGEGNSFWFAFYIGSLD
ncbi:hypothetical protein TIFTF001_000735 [Ficus carica]|uniref:Uncharacterized protein n=1 Tax=Ficus carica TaxID=3494 RepID=A0AA87YWV5_FICCA|nr:hypothetical protein TIFTF001_000735 [Ficus carica]